MKRIQLIVEEWQHEWLMQESSRMSMTASALLRELLTEAIGRRQIVSLEGDPLWGIVGMAAGPEDGVTSENLDHFLYTQNRDQQPLYKVAETPQITEGVYGKADSGNH